MTLILVGQFLALGLLFWLVILQRWQRGLYLLFVYMPFGGMVTLLLYPSSYPTLFKDFLFVIPAYLSFLFSWKYLKLKIQIPIIIIGVIFALALLVLVQISNPNVANFMVAAIGMKVWLFYLPLIFLGSAMITSQYDLIRVLRLMIVIAWVPCVIGITQWALSMTFGHQKTMIAFYGPAAAGATQNFVRLSMGGTFFRIPSTFTYVAQYFGYTLAMIVPAYTLMRLDLEQIWRRFALMTLGLVIIASFLSGARAAFLFVPLLLTLMFLLDGKFTGILRASIFLPILLLFVMSTGKIDLFRLYDAIFELIMHYSDEIVFRGISDAVQIAPFGLGTGMNTGAARYAFVHPESFVAFENYYAKAVYELGIMGLIVVVSLFISLIYYGFKLHQRIKNRNLRACSSAILAFIILMSINSFKGWQIDLDPINVYFWVFAGILFKLKNIDSDLVKNNLITLKE